MNPVKLVDWILAVLVVVVLLIIFSLVSGCTVVRVNSRDCVPNIRFEFFAVTIESCEERAPGAKPRAIEGAIRAARYH